MAHLLDTLRHTIAARRLFAGTARGSSRAGVVVACSGGPDSTALAHALHRLAPELGLALTLASVDHGLRPEAAAEVAAVGRFARSLGLPFVPLAVRVEAPGVGVLAAARDARYEALHALAHERGASAIAVGHTRDDQAETVLSRMLRGAGIAGLGGIEPARTDGIIRPLIDCSRADVLAYLDEHGLEAIADPSNRDLRFERPRIRHSLLPALESEDPRVREHLARLADEARALAAYLDSEADGVLRAVGEGAALPVERFAALPGPLRVAALRRWVERETGRAPGRAHVDAIDALFRARGEVLLPRGFEIVREGDALVLRSRGSCAARDALRRRTKRGGRGERQTDDTSEARRPGNGGAEDAGSRPAGAVTDENSSPRDRGASE